MSKSSGETPGLEPFLPKSSRNGDINGVDQELTVLSRILTSLLVYRPFQQHSHRYSHGFEQKRVEETVILSPHPKENQA